jgi:DNA mismatch endonuclease, patch repair protein
MADLFTKEKRSEVMSRIRGKNTNPEYFVRSVLYQQGFRFRLHDHNLPGKPDLVLSKYKALIFVHGCFWHGHNCLLFK